MTSIAATTEKIDTQGSSTSAAPDIKFDHDGRLMEVDYSRLKFLVIDDSRFYRTVIKNALAVYRINNILEAADAKDAIDTMCASAVDFVLVDYEMPEMDGVEFVRRVRWSEGQGMDPKVPIIMISQHTDTRIVLSAREAGVHEFIGKPITPTNLFKRIRLTLENPRPFIVAETYRGPDRRWIKRDD